MKLVKDVEQTTLCCNYVGVYRAKNGADVNEDGLSQFWQPNKLKANGRCFTVVSVIDECWYVKFRHMKRI